MSSRAVIVHLYKDEQTHEYPLNSLCEKRPDVEVVGEYWTSLGPAVTCPDCLERMRKCHQQ